MPKKSKLKCPKCKSKDFDETHHDCPSCNCGTIYTCNNIDCFCEFDENGEEI
jgi:hypothetical protein